jgi:hypothetical protein
MGEMCWVQGVLYLRLESWHSWKVFTAFPQYMKPDTVKGCSKGYATMQHLIKLGWTYAK